MESEKEYEEYEEVREVIHPTLIAIDLDTRKRAIEMLSTTLATVFDLYSALKTAHWNIKGVVFISLHKLFDELADEALNIADGVGERITALGGTAIGTVKCAAEKTKLEEFKVNPYDGASYLYQLAGFYSLIGAHLREASRELDELGDITTANYYLELAMQIDKNLYFIEAHLQLH